MREAALHPAKSSENQSGSSPGSAVGKATRVDAPAEPSIQRKPSSDAPTGGADGHAIAARGVAGASSDYPHRQRIESLFGREVSAKAALGGDATEACAGLGAQAYTRGDQVAFATGSPDLHLAAHEAAHTLQQSGGIQLAGGFGQAGDEHERMADQAADHVVRGESGAHLFAPGRSGSAPGGVQLPPVGPGGGGASWAAVLAGARRPGPAGIAHDYQGALTALEALSLVNMLGALQQVSRMGELENFYANAGAHGSARARTAFQTIVIENNLR